MKTILALLALLYTRLLSDGSDSDSGSGDLSASGRDVADSANVLGSSGTDPNQHGSSGQPTDPSATMSADDLQDIPPG